MQVLVVVMLMLIIIDTPPSSLTDSIRNPKVKIVEEKIIRARSLVRNTSRVEGRVGALGWGLIRFTRNSIIHTDLYKPNHELVSA